MTNRSLPISPGEFPETGLVRVGEFVSRQQAKGVLPITRSSWFRGVKGGYYPRPIKMGSAAFWRAEHIRAIAEGRDWRDAS
jgi:predicted DNA-binding transcriptional regulator AlpA